MEDKQIVDLYWQRSDLAISETNQKYGRYCRTIAYNICGIAEDAEECVNDTWFRAWNLMPDQRPSVLSVSPEAFLLIVSRQTTESSAVEDKRASHWKNLKSASPAEPILNRLWTQKNWKRQSEASFRDCLRMRKRSSYCGTGISSPFPRYPKSCVIVRGKSKAPCSVPAGNCTPIYRRRAYAELADTSSRYERHL